MNSVFPPLWRTFLRTDVLLWRTGLLRTAMWRMGLHPDTEQHNGRACAERGNVKPWGSSGIDCGGQTRRPASRHIPSPLARVAKLTDERAQPSRRQRRVKQKWRRRNADTSGQQTERHAANGTAKATVRVQGVSARVQIKIFFWLCHASLNFQLVLNWKFLLAMFSGRNHLCGCMHELKLWH